jgi:DNA-binding GntR family transcriptional regulator
MKGKAAARPTVVDGHEVLPRLPPRTSTVEHAASVLRATIAEGRLPPGTRLREEHVAESFAISRNTVREVFLLLAHERLVEHVAYRGVHVRRMGAEDIRAMYRTRRLVEPLGLRAAITDAGVRATMQAAVDGATAAAERNDWNTVGTEDIEFHRAIFDGCHSVHISAMCEQLLAELRLAFLQLPDPEPLHLPYLARNRRILELVEAGEEAAGVAELDDYLTCSEAEMLRSIGA